MAPEEPLTTLLREGQLPLPSPSPVHLSMGIGANVSLSELHRGTIKGCLRGDEVLRELDSVQDNKERQLLMRLAHFSVLNSLSGPVSISIGQGQKFPESALYFDLPIILENQGISSINGIPRTTLLYAYQRESPMAAVNQMFTRPGLRGVISLDEFVRKQLPESLLNEAKRIGDLVRDCHRLDRVEGVSPQLLSHLALNLTKLLNDIDYNKISEKLSVYQSSQRKVSVAPLAVDRPLFEQVRESVQRVLVKASEPKLQPKMKR